MNTGETIRFHDPCSTELPFPLEKTELISLNLTEIFFIPGDKMLTSHSKIIYVKNNLSFYFLTPKMPIQEKASRR